MDGKLLIHSLHFSSLLFSYHQCSIFVTPILLSQSSKNFISQLRRDMRKMLFRELLTQFICCFRK